MLSAALNSPDHSTNETKRALSLQTVSRGPGKPLSWSQRCLCSLKLYPEYHWWILKWWSKENLQYHSGLNSKSTSTSTMKNQFLYKTCKFSMHIERPHRTGGNDLCKFHNHSHLSNPYEQDLIAHELLLVSEDRYTPFRTTNSKEWRRKDCRHPTNVCTRLSAPRWQVVRKSQKYWFWTNLEMLWPALGERCMRRIFSLQTGWSQAFASDLNSSPKPAEPPLFVSITPF